MGRKKNLKLREKEKRAKINNALLKDAVAAHQDGKLNKAETLYNRILDSNPNHIEALHFYGLLTHQNGDYEKAVALVNRAIIVKPGEASLYVNRGVSQKMMGNFEDAVDSYRAAVEIAPDNAEAYRNLGSVLKDLEDYEGALDNFTRAAELNSTHAGALKAMEKLIAEKRKVALEIKELLEADDSIDDTLRNSEANSAGRMPVSTEFPENSDPDHKICSKCKVKKPRSEFHKNKYTRDELKAACKECVNRQAREYRSRVRERLNSNKTPEKE